jgi:hypothetical protein
MTNYDELFVIPDFPEYSITKDGRVWSNQFSIAVPAPVRHIAAGPTYAVVLLANGKVLVWASDNSEGWKTKKDLICQAWNGKLFFTQKGVV